MFKRKNSKKNIGKINIRKYKYWQALYMSFYSRKLYIDVAKCWRGFGLTYCLILLTVVTIPLGFKSILYFNKYLNQDLIMPIAEIPEFSIVDGEVIFKHDMPYFIKNQLGQIVFIIDTTGKINGISDKYPDLIMLINKSKYFFRDIKPEFVKNDNKNLQQYNKQEIHTYDITTMEDEVFNGEKWVKETKLYSIKNYSLILIYPLLVSGFYGVISTILIVFSIMGQVASYAIFKHRLRFKESCRLMSVSSSFGVALFLVLKTLGFNSLKLNFLCMVLVFIYFSYAVLCIKRDSRQLVCY